MKLQQATELGLPSHIVCDAGKTEVARGTRTVLAIAGTLCFASINEQRELLLLGMKSEVDKVTGKLRLLH